MRKPTVSKRKDKSFHGANLRFARTFHGLALAELGKRIAVSRQYLQRLEVDPTTSPNDDLVAALAEVLHVESAFFSKPLVEEVQDEDCRFRKRKTTPLRVRKRALSYGTIFNLIVSYLDSELELPPIQIPRITAKTREDIERAAEKCRLRWGLHLDAPIHNVVRALECSGALVTTFEGVSSKIDAFSYVNGRPVVVRNFAKDGTSQARLDLAHELGHLVLHHGTGNDDVCLEDQADYFASAFLLPRAAFVREFPKSIRMNWTQIFGMKARWGVSVQAIIRRAYDLGIINAVQYRNANIYISRNGWKTKEPGEENISVENSEIVPAGFEVLEEQGVSPDTVARKLNVSLFIIRKFGIPLKHHLAPKER
jgi:Zn-dependent peptidase ImmA (M78 family)/DNA-binding XRE family transcriptional regulator